MAGATRMDPFLTALSYTCCWYPLVRNWGAQFHLLRSAVQGVVLRVLATGSSLTTKTTFTNMTKLFGLRTTSPCVYMTYLLSPEQMRWDYKSVVSFRACSSSSSANLSETTALYSPLQKGCLASRSWLLRSLSFLRGYVLNLTQIQGVLITRGLLIAAEGRNQTSELYYLLKSTSWYTRVCEEYDLFLTTYREKLLLSLVSRGLFSVFPGSHWGSLRDTARDVTYERPCSTEALGPEGKSRRKCG